MRQHVFIALKEAQNAMRVQKRNNPSLAGKKRTRGIFVEVNCSIILGRLGIGWVEMTGSAATYSMWKE